MAIIPACKVSSSSSINSSNLSLDHIDSLSPFFCSVYSLACSFTNWDVSCDVRVCRVDRMTGRLVSCCFDLSCCCHLVWTRIVVVLTVTLECGDVRVNWVSVLSTLAPHIVGIVSFFPLHCYFIHIAQSTGELVDALLVWQPLKSLLVHLNLFTSWSFAFSDTLLFPWTSFQLF